MYDPFRLDYEPGVGLKLPDATLPDGVSESRLGARWDLLRRLGGSRDWRRRAIKTGQLRG